MDKVRRKQHEELEAILGCAVWEVESPEQKIAGQTYMPELNLLVDKSLSEVEYKLISKWLRNDMTVEEVTEHQLLIDEHAYRRYNRTLKFPIRLWSVQFRDNFEEVEAVLKSAFEEDITAVPSHSEIVVFVSNTEILPGDLVEMIEAEALTSARVVVGNKCTQISEIYKSYQQLSELLSLAGQLKNSFKVATYESSILPLLIQRLKHPDTAQVNNPALILDSVMRHQLKSVGDDELEQTAIVFFENNLNISETANKLYIHRNTLIYRLNKLEAITGYDIRKFNDAINYYLNFLVDKIQ